MPLPQYEEEQKDPITLEKERLHEIVKDIPIRIGVHAGKGGVGKTFLACQLAMLLAESGKDVGLLDADVDCPNVPSALGITEDLDVTENGKLLPRIHNGVKVVSTGLLQTGDDPLIIRGPIKHRLLTDFIEKTEWGALDTLIYDFPPGTSDVPLSAMQVANLTGVLLVTTPDKSALKDVGRTARMARNLDVPTIGLVENMSGEVFGTDEAERVADELGIPYTTTIPLSKEIRKTADAGKLALPESAQKALLELF